MPDILEKPWTLETPDGFTIYGVLNSANIPSKSAIFMVHGLTGHMYEYHFKRAADTFAQDYDVYRFNLYDGNKNGRELKNCTLDTHAQDLNTVLENFSAAYDKIFLIGHSYGGVTVMLAQPSICTAASLWDPSFDLKDINETFAATYSPELNAYILNWGVSYLMSKAMHEQGNALDLEACIELSKNFKHPVQVLHAGNGYFIHFEVSYHSFGNPKNVRDVVSGTEHCFYEGNSCDELLEKTKSWFDSF